MISTRQNGSHQRSLRVRAALLLCALLSCLPSRSLRIGHCERTGASAVEVSYAAADETACLGCCDEQPSEPRSCCGDEREGGCGDEEPDDGCCHQLQLNEQVLPLGDDGAPQLFAPDLPPSAFAIAEEPAQPPHAQRTQHATGPPVRHRLRRHIAERRAVVLLI